MPSLEDVRSTVGRSIAVGLTIVAAVALAVVAVAAASSRAQSTPASVAFPEASALRCGAFAIKGRIGGRTRCLGDLQRCDRRVEKGYQRYGFHCRAGVLVATWRRLQRPLHLPRWNLAEPCPISQIDPDVDFRKYGAGGGIGSGPVYPAPFDPVHGTPINSFAVPESWVGGKEAIVMLSAYRGPVLIRGGQLGGQGAITFASNEIPGAPRLPDKDLELRIPVPHSRPVTHTFFFLDPPGCFAYQIDGTTFSTIVVFEVTMSRSG
jgi:hypothetical protein